MGSQRDRGQVEEIIVKNIGEALLAPREKIVASARLLSELGAESIDIADLRFRLEHELGIKIDQKRMLESLGTNLTAAEFDARFTVGFVIDHVCRLLATIEEQS